MKIMIVGCAGSGKTTLAKALHQIYQIPLIHLDQHYWSANWVPTPHEAWIEKVHQLMNASTDWIIDGNYTSSMKERLMVADQVILLDFSRFQCLTSVVLRRIKYNKKSRDDMPSGCFEKIDVGFLKWIWNFNHKSRPRILTMIEESNVDDVIVLKNRTQVKKYIQQMQISTNNMHR
jgi:adenylate kinase family enzyme